MDLDTYQKRALSTRQVPAKTKPDDPIISLLGLAGEAGELLTEYKKYLREGEMYRPFKERICEELGDLLWYVASVADEFNLQLGEVANANLSKVESRWGTLNSDGWHLPDSNAAEGEQFPRKFAVKFESFEEGSLSKVRMLLEDGTTLGSPLTDNAHTGDGYRFHDLFHLACVARLGWSPVVRALMKRKRKSDLSVDEVEDGGRAVAIEEGISALVFAYANEHGKLERVDEVDYELLRIIKSMTTSLEIRNCSLHDWEQTILAAFSVWRIIERNEGGIVIVDLSMRTIEVE